ncbi:MAG: hypothetical protein WD355_08660 [Balneolaceae bacterium]
MNQHVVQPASYSSGQPIEGVQQVMGYTSHPYTAWVSPLSVSQGSGKRNSEQYSGHEESCDEEGEAPVHPPFFQLAVNISYQELIRYFLVPGHERIFSLQTRLRSEKSEKLPTIFFPDGDTPKQFEKIRKYLYSVQIQLLQTPKGLHCHLVL